MEHPPCPTCQQGHLLPMSGLDQGFLFWVCSSPECSYVVSGSAGVVTYYKGTAVWEEKENGDKKWREFSF